MINISKTFYKKTRNNRFLECRWKIQGSGMSLIMTDVNTYIGIANPLVSGIIIGVIGLFFAIINYPVYKRILTSRLKKYATKIIELSDKIVQD